MKIKHVFSLILIGLAAVAVSYYFYIWLGYPRGNDAIGHVFKIKVIGEFWPHYHWTHSWGGGMPQFLKYPIWAYLPLGLIYRLTAMDIGLLLTAVGVGTVAISAMGIYLIVVELSDNWLASLVSGLIYVVTPAAWSYAFSGGIYARAMATPFLVLALWTWVRVLKAEKKGKFARGSWFWTVIFLAASFLSHYVVGAVAWVLVGAWGLIGIKGWKQKLGLLTRTFLVAGLLTAGFSLPFIMNRPSTEWLGDVSELVKSASWSELAPLYYEEQGAYYLNRMSPFLLPLGAILLIGVFWLRRKELKKNYLLWRSIWFLLLISVVIVVYCKVIIGFLDAWYAILGIPVGMYHYLAILMAPLVGILLAKLMPTRRWRWVPALVVLIVLSFWIKFQLGVLGGLRIEHISSVKSFGTREMVERTMDGLDQQFNFRLGVETAVIGGWFNVKYPYVPQTRDYFGQGVVDQDQRFYLMYSLFNLENNYEEVNFLMDWWGVKQFVVHQGEKGEMRKKYISKPEFYDWEDTDGGDFDVFEFREPSPILTATDVLPVLFIGKDDSYKIFFRDFALANLNSRQFISVHDKERIDSYSLEELEKFPVIFLYDYDYVSKRKTVDLLEDYLKGGGGVVIESRLREEELDQVLPVMEIERGDFGKEWQLSQTDEGKSALGEIDEAQFGPAIFGEGPWGVGIAGEVKEWAETLFLEAGKPILVGGEKGKGRIIWSGFNLPYHIATYKSEEESEMLGEMIRWVANEEEKEVSWSSENKSLIYETEDFEAVFVNPEERVLKLKRDMRGGLLKEFYFSNWKAYVKGGEKLKIYRAGPEFMYVVLDGLGEGEEVVFKYQRSWIEQGSRVIAWVTLLGLVWWLIGWPSSIKARLKKVENRLLAPVRDLTGWWEDDGD